MRRLIGVLFLCFFVFFTGCSQQIDAKIKGYDVKQTVDEQTEDEFIFRLASEKEVYEEGEEVELYGEITYTGDMPLTISHASSFIIFDIQEVVRDYHISSTVREIGVMKELAPMEVYEEKYNKDGVYYSDQNELEYQKFVADFMDRDGFPPGYYTVEGKTAFHDGVMHREIQAEVDFKVLPKEG